MAGRLPKPAAALLVLLTVARGLIYVLVIPPWQTPDEPSHFGYARFVTQTHGLPPPRGAPVDPQITASMARFDFWRLRYQASEPSSSDLPNETRMASVHPLLYYLLAALVLTPLRDQELILQLYALRLCSVLMAALTVLVAFRTVKLLFPDDPVLPVTVTVFIASLPMHAFMSASVNNDNLAELVASLVICLLVLTLRDGVSPLKGVAVFVLLGAGYITKRTTFFTVPLALAFAPIYCWTRAYSIRDASLTVHRQLTSLASAAARVGKTVLRSHSLRYSLLLVVILGLIGAVLWPFVTARRDGPRDNAIPWVEPTGAHQQYLPLSTKAYDPSPPSRVEATIGRILKILRISPSDFGSALSEEATGLPRLPSYLLFCLLTFASFWANFGWMNVPLDPAWYALLAVISLLAFLGLLRRILREIRPSCEQTLLPSRWQKGALLILILASLLIFVQTFGLMIVQNIPQQARYLFPAIVPLSTLFILGLREVVPARYRRGLPLICLLSLFLFDSLCIIGYILPHYYS
jgi:4-amino-4-deoxy-L-arabinose transferase-like glycosyltransferase